MKLSINGKIAEFVPRVELAKMCGRTYHAFIALERRKIVPPANYSTKTKAVYSKELCNKLQVIFAGITQGVKVTPEQQQKINLAFQEEREFFNS